MAFKRVGRKVGRSGRQAGRQAGGQEGRQVVGAKEVYFKQKRQSIWTFKRLTEPSYFPFCLEKQWLSSAKKQSQESYTTMPCFIVRTSRLTLCLQLQMCHFGFGITLKTEHKK